MSRAGDTFMAFSYGFLATSLIYLSCFGVFSFRLPPRFISICAVLFLSSVAVAFEPVISGNIAVDSMIAGIVAYLCGAVLVNGLLYLSRNFPDRSNFLTIFFITSLLVRGWFWAEEEVEFEI